MPEEQQAADSVHRGVTVQAAVGGECSQCGFAIWTPVIDLPTSAVGLYDDARYPGRLLVSVRDHYDHLDEMPANALAAFMTDVGRAARALRGWDDILRVNIAILGNVAAHVHAHLIPRRANDPNVTRAPWDGADSLSPLATEDKTRIVNDLREAIARVDQT